MTTSFKCSAWTPSRITTRDAMLAHYGTLDVSRAYYQARTETLEIPHEKIIMSVARKREILVKPRMIIGEHETIEEICDILNFSYGYLSGLKVDKSVVRIVLRRMWKRELQRLTDYEDECENTDLKLSKNEEKVVKAISSTWKSNNW